MNQFTPDERNRLKSYLRGFIDVYAAIAEMKEPVSWRVVKMAVRYSELANDPMNVSAIAAFTQIPRPTVRRHLADMEKRKMVTLSQNGETVPRLCHTDSKSLKLLTHLLKTSDRVIDKVSNSNTPRRKTG